MQKMTVDSAKNQTINVHFADKNHKNNDNNDNNDDNDDDDIEEQVLVEVGADLAIKRSTDDVPIPRVTNGKLAILKSDDDLYYFRIIDSDGQMKLKTQIIKEMPLWFDENTRSIHFCKTSGQQAALFIITVTDKLEESKVKTLWKSILAMQTSDETFDKNESGRPKIDNEVANDNEISFDLAQRSPRKSIDMRSYFDDALSSDESSEEEEEAIKYTGERKSLAHDLRREHGPQNLAVGIKNHRAFFNRGSKLVVAKHDARGEMEYVGKFDRITSNDGRSILSPSKLLLYDGDDKMLFLSGEDKSKVYNMDVETGKVVSEWNNGVDIIRNIGHTSKYQELTSKQVILGVNNNSVFTMDMRSNELAQNKQYSKPLNFSVTATTVAGETAIASDNGDIRLYNNVSKNAKTVLPGLGDPIIHLDATADGSYLLATTKRYLLVISLNDADKNSGFDKSIAKSAAPYTKLQLRPEDFIKYKMTEPNFTAAHFDIGEHNERWIVTSTGPYVVIWNFDLVKRGKPVYRIRLEDENVVADQFIYNQDRQVVVATPSNLAVESGVVNWY